MATSFRHVQAALVVLCVAAPVAGCLGINALKAPDASDGSPSDAAGGSTLDVGDSWVPDATTHGDAAADDAKTGADGSGAACVSGATCTPADCQTGTFTCGADGGQCMKIANLADGMPCGSGGTSVCHAGSCGTCASGSDCTDMSNVCVKKTIDCSSGQAVCKVAMNAPDGTPCTNGQYCYAGVCSACMVGNACSPASNPCHTGKVTSCAGGTMTCTDQNAPASAGTSCQASGVSSGVCDGNGACKACTPNAICTPPGKPCQQGTMTCTSGPVCASPVNINEAKSCGSGQICSAGACVACDGVSCASGCCDSTGCVTAAQNGGNCGTKGAACVPCASGEICTMGGGGCSCPPSASTSCNGACTNTQTDQKNCGTCGHDCTALKNVSGAVSCVAGACSFPASSCAAGWMHCSSNVNDGCETDITKPGTCGGCATVCPATAPKCSGSGTSYMCVTGCSAPTPTLCGSTCVDTTSNASYCGNCMTACSGGMTCQNSQCKCPAGQLDCSGVCQTPSPQNGCGSSASCTACQGPSTGSNTGAPSCSAASTCAISCSASYPQLCGSACVNTSSDMKNCGGCNVACATNGQACSGGSCVCTVQSCPSGCCMGNTCGQQNACGGCGAVNGGTLNAPCGPCNSGQMKCVSMQSVACNVTTSTCPQSDQECGVNTCQCYGGAKLTCKDQTQVCGGWSFESVDPNNPAEGWSLQPGNFSPGGTISVQARSGGVNWLAVTLPANPTGVFFNIIKNLCWPSNGGTTALAGKTLSYVIEVVPPPPPSTIDLINQTQILDDSSEQSIGPIDTQIASEPFSFQSQTISALPAGRAVAQLVIQLQLQYNVTTNETVYIHDIVLQ